MKDKTIIIRISEEDLAAFDAVVYEKMQTRSQVIRSAMQAVVAASNHKKWRKGVTK